MKRHQEKLCGKVKKLVELTLFKNNCVKNLSKGISPFHCVGGCKSNSLFREF